MQILLNSLKKSERGQRLALIVVYSINVIALSIFMMFATGVSNVYNDRFDTSDASQILVILCSVVGIAIICTSILQWLTTILSRSIFDSRENFNVNIRLIGGSQDTLHSIYIKEILNMQFIAIPVGIILAEIAWRLIAEIYTDFGLWIGFYQIVASICIHLLTVFIASYFKIKKLCSFNIVNQLTGTCDNISKPKINKFQIICFTLGLIIIIINHICLININIILTSLCDFISIILMFNSLILGVNYIILYLGKALSLFSIMISQINILGQYKKLRKIMITIFLGVFVSTCLQMTLNTVKEDMYLYSLSNIKYSDSFEYSNFVDESIIQNIIDKYDVRYSTGVYCMGNIHHNSEEFFCIQGIDSQHCPGLEDFKFKNCTSNIEDRFNDDKFDGIILPQSYISENDIGKICNICIDDQYNQECKFVISGGYCYNNAGKWYTALVSKSYLQHCLNQDGKINIVYVSKLPKALEKELNNIEGVKVKNHITRMGIAMESKEKAIQSSIVVSIPAFIIFICAIIMASSNFIINKKQNIKDICKFRGFGVNLKRITFIYIFQIFNIILQSFILGVLAAFTMCNVLTYIMIGPEYMLSKMLCPYKFIFILFASIMLITILIFFFSIRKGLSRDFVSVIRED